MEILYIILIILGLLGVAVGFIFLVNFISRKKKGMFAEAEFVKKMLPNIDCGMCGEKNCTEFAKKVANNERNPEECKLIKPEVCEKIKEYFKPTYKQSTKMVAIVKCKGGCRAVDKYNYKGSDNCVVEEGLHSGSKACKFACLGCGDCVRACRFKAIKVNKRKVAEVDRSKCTGCGACVKSCPNKLIAMQKLALSVQVICNNQSSDPAIEKKCEVGCTHCGNCLKACPVGAIKIVNNVPVIDESKCIECFKCVASCPHHCISRL